MFSSSKTSASLPNVITSVHECRGEIKKLSTLTQNTAKNQDPPHRFKDGQHVPGAVHKKGSGIVMKRRKELKRVEVYNGACEIGRAHV